MLLGVLLVMLVEMLLMLAVMLVQMLLMLAVMLLMLRPPLAWHLTQAPTVLSTCAPTPAEKSMSKIRAARQHEHLHQHDDIHHQHPPEHNAHQPHQPHRRHQRHSCDSWCE